jgi:hypothetical protein
MLANIVYTKLVFPFSNIIYLFVKDFKGLDSVTQLLALWLLCFKSPFIEVLNTISPCIIILKE